METFREKLLNYISEREEASGGELLERFASGIPRGASRVMLTLLGLELTNEITSYKLGNRVIYRPVR